MFDSSTKVRLIVKTIQLLISRHLYNVNNSYTICSLVDDGVITNKSFLFKYSNLSGRYSYSCTLQRNFLLFKKKTKQNKGLTGDSFAISSVK